ncbi:MAG: hypothetical protein P4L69_17530 [Desulfosporosinus sp.]|nr:hypothetical protein [Desulfosporosinus sp.]
MSIRICCLPAVLPVNDPEKYDYCNINRKWYKELDVSGWLWKIAYYPLRPAKVRYQPSAVCKISAGTLILQMR